MTAESLARASTLAASMARCAHPMKDRSATRPGSNIYALRCNRCGASIVEGQWRLPAAFVVELARALDEEHPVQTCACGQSYTADTWETLEFVSTWHAGDTALELRRCHTCLSTLSVVVGAVFLRVL
jgi:hypothetical protein